MSSEDGGHHESPEEELHAIEEVEEKNRRILTYTIIGLIVVLVIVGIAVFAVSRGDDDKSTTTTSTTSTTAATTTTTTAPVDPRQKYAGLEHDDRGAGLTLGTEIRSAGYRSGFGGSPKNGDYAYFWVRDEKGDMLWLDQITKASNTADPIRSKVVAVWDLPTITDSQAMCLGWCYDAAGNEDTTVVGLFNDGGTPLKAWRVDPVKPSFTSISATGWKLYPDFEDIPPLDIPARPALYGTVALADATDRATYSAVEQVTAGGGASYGDAFVMEVNDYKENRTAASSSK